MEGAGGYSSKRGIINMSAAKAQDQQCESTPLFHSRSTIDGSNPSDGISSQLNPSKINQWVNKGSWSVRNPMNEQSRARAKKIGDYRSKYDQFKKVGVPQQ